MTVTKNIMPRISSTTHYSIDCCTSTRKPGEYNYWWMQIPKLIHRLTCLQVPQDEHKLSREAATEEGLDELLLARWSLNYLLLVLVSRVLVLGTHIMSFVMLRQTEKTINTFLSNRLQIATRFIFGITSYSQYENRLSSPTYFNIPLGKHWNNINRPYPLSIRSSLIHNSQYFFHQNNKHIHRYSSVEMISYKIIIQMYAKQSESKAS